MRKSYLINPCSTCTASILLDLGFGSVWLLKFLVGHRYERGWMPRTSNIHVARLSTRTLTVRCRDANSLFRVKHNFFRSKKKCRDQRKMSETSELYENIFWTMPIYYYMSVWKHLIPRRWGYSTC